MSEAFDAHKLDPSNHTLEQHAAIFGLETEARAKNDSVMGKVACYEALTGVVGLDPVLAVIDDRADAIPAQGWLISGKLAPGYGGVIETFRYPAEALKIGSARDNRAGFGEARLFLSLEQYGLKTLVYENPNFPHKDVEPDLRMSQSAFAAISFADSDIAELGNGGRILIEKDLMRLKDNNGINFSLDWVDIERYKDACRDVSISRVTDDFSQVQLVLVQLSRAMGLDYDDTEKLVGALVAKLSPLE